MEYTDNMKVADQLDDINIKIEVLEDISRSHRTNLFWKRIEELYQYKYKLEQQLYN